MPAFSHATGKFARAGLGWQELSCQSVSQRQDGFHLPHRPGRLWDAGFTFGRRALSFIYIASFVWKAEFFFLSMQNICPVIADNPGQIYT